MGENSAEHQVGEIASDPSLVDTPLLKRAVVERLPICFGKKRVPPEEQGEQLERMVSVLRAQREEPSCAREYRGSPGGRPPETARRQTGRHCSRAASGHRW